MNSGERERERERAKGRSTHAPAPFARTELQSAPFVSTSAVNRDLAPSIAISPSRRSRSTHRFARLRSTLREIAPSIAISPSRRSRSREVARCFARSRLMARSSERSSRSIALSNPVERQSRFCPCFSGFVFSFFFSKYQKIFFEKFLKMQPNT